MKKPPEGGRSRTVWLAPETMEELRALVGTERRRTGYSVSMVKIVAYLIHREFEKSKVGDA